MNMSKKFDKRKKVVYELICDDLYTPMKFKELAMLLRVAKEDRDELRQILESLEQEGKIYLSATAWEKERLFSVTVRDEGVGIRDVEQAMEPMFTTCPEDGRSGMGFSFMEAFMDRVEVVSAPGKGTSVTMKKKIGR